MKELAVTIPLKYACPKESIPTPVLVKGSFPTCKIVKGFVVPTPTLAVVDIPASFSITHPVLAIATTPVNALPSPIN